MDENLNLYWGDPHIHSTASWRCFEFDNTPDGYDGSPADCYRYARDEAGMDFGAVTDHDCGLAGDFDLKDKDWEAIQQAAADFNDPGNFVSFRGWEYSSNAGHWHVLYSEDSGPVLGCSEYTAPPDLWDALRHHDPNAITIPHHIARTGMPMNWDHFDEQFVPAVEICSIWGVYEHPMNAFECEPNWAPSEPEGFAYTGLQQGLRFGFLGGGDVHDGRAGGHCLGWDIPDLKERWAVCNQLRRNPLGCGIAGVYATELSRKALLEGIRAHRTLAATGMKTPIEMDVDGLFIGSEAPATDEQMHKRRITISASADCPLHRIEIIRNGHILRPLPCSEPHERFEITDECPLEDVAPEITSGNRRSVYYYARVIRSDHRMAWSSPIWLGFG